MVVYVKYVILSWDSEVGIVWNRNGLRKMYENENFYLRMHWKCVDFENLYKIVETSKWGKVNFLSLIIESSLFLVLWSRHESEFKMGKKVLYAAAVHRNLGKMFK